MSKQSNPSDIVVTVSPLLVNAENTANMLGISKSYLVQLDLAGKVPSAVTCFGKRKLWSTEELSAWVASGCPARETWEAIILKRTEGAT